MSKRTERIAAAKARPIEETEARRDAERAVTVRQVKINGQPVKMVGNKVVE